MKNHNNLSSFQQNYLPLFFLSLKLAQIEYCVLRNFTMLPESTGGSDLDLLVHQNDYKEFMTILYSYVKSYDLKIVSIINNNVSTKICITNEFGGVQIDVFKGAVYFGKRVLIDSDLLFEKTYTYNQIQVLDPKIGALLAFLKELLNNRKCSLKYIIELQEQFSDTKIETRYLTQFSTPFYIYINKYLSELNKEHCLNLYSIAKKKFYKSHFVGLNNKVKRLLKQPGFSIAFLGTDGSGKSTIINNIKPILNDPFHNAIYYEHMRPNIVPSIARFLGNKEDLSRSVTNPHRSSSSGFLGSLIRWSYYMTDYTLGFYWKVYPKKSIHSCVWIFDRYYYDYLIDPKRGRIKLPYWILKFGQVIIPEPDIILCLGADAETIHNRKPELPLEEIERQVSALKKFCRSHKRAVWIDTGKNINESSQDALEAILKVMAKRFESVKLTE